MTDFKKYPSIVNLYKLNETDECDNLDLDRVWSVYEKVDGCNFSIKISRSESCPETLLLKYGRRSGYLSEKDQFHSFLQVLGPHLEGIKAVFKAYETILKESSKVLTRMIIYGELFGGAYKCDCSNTCIHKQGVKTKHPVINRVMYSKGIEFLAFDIFVESTDERYYLGQEYMLKYAALIPVVQELFSGTLRECIEYSTANLEQNSTIPLYYSLPEMRYNPREGHVIKPFSSRDSKQTIFKHKSPKFEEKTSKLPTVQVRSDVINHIVKTYLTKNRLESVKSKYTEDCNQFKLESAWATDAVNDYVADLPVSEREKYDHRTTKQMAKRVITRWRQQAV